MNLRGHDLPNKRAHTGARLTPSFRSLRSGGAWRVAVATVLPHQMPARHRGEDTQISKEPLNSCTKHIITKLNAQHISVTQKCKRISRIPALWHPKNSHALARTQWVQVPVNLQRRQKCIHVLCSFEVKSSHNGKDVEEYAHPNVPRARFACLAGKSSWNGMRSKTPKPKTRGAKSCIRTFRKQMGWDFFANRAAGEA